ncbi:MAG TPA: dihydrodipicolinate synthase family protein [Bacteroidia bacterium]|nr:dihydrodipicolinate synthase family protein [Bacteroidia bacterium]
MGKEITGTVIPLPTPFNKNYEVDYGSLYNYVKFLIESGIKTVMTTVGTSRFNLLTEEEVKKVNETVVKAAGGRIVTIVANPQVGGTSKAIEFAKHSESIGADYFLTYFPERFYGDANTYSFFKAINDSVSKTGILLHEMPMRNGFGAGNIPFSLELLRKLTALPNIKGLKEEALDAEHSNRIVAALKDKAIIIGAGGGMSRFYNRDYNLGARAFLGGIGNFFPQLELDFYELMMKGDLEKAGKIIHEIELPYFEKTVPIGWHPSLKAALAVLGLMPEFERPPMKQVTGEELEILRSVLNNNGWLQAAKH